MQTSTSIKDIALALSKAQAEFPAISKDAKNPFFKSNYATLDKVIETVKPILAKHGLAISQGNEATESGLIVTTILMHISGEWIRSELSMPVVKNDPQGFGSTQSYGRRYSYASILGLATESDDDANSASQKNGSIATPVRKIQPKYTKPDPIMEATTTKCPECGATGAYHRPDCSLK